MKWNNDCIRDILKVIETIPYNETLTVEKLCEMLSKYKNDEILGAMALLNREHFVYVLDRNGYNDFDIYRENKIRCLSERGYRTLDCIRDDKVWNLMKEKQANFNDISFFTIISLASKIQNQAQNEAFGLSNTFFTDYSRW